VRPSRVSPLEVEEFPRLRCLRRGKGTIPRKRESRIFSGTSFRGDFFPVAIPVHGHPEARSDLVADAPAPGGGRTKTAVPGRKGRASGSGESGRRSPSRTARTGRRGGFPGCGPQARSGKERSRRRGENRTGRLRLMASAVYHGEGKLRLTGAEQKKYLI